jgi:hypothetical protein
MILHIHRQGDRDRDVDFGAISVEF